MLVDRTRAATYMHRYGLDALVATSPVNVTYVTGYRCWLDGQFKEHMVNPGGTVHALPTLAILPLDGKPILVVDAMLAVNALDLPNILICPFGVGNLAWAEALPNIGGTLEDLYSQLTDEPRPAHAIEALAKALADARLNRARLGVELEGLAPPVAVSLATTLAGARLLDCAHLFHLIRMVKNATELGRLQRVTTIAETAAAAALEIARPGSPVRDLAQCFRTQVASLGADMDHFAYGIRGLGLATEPNYQLQPDDVLYIDYGCVYDSYCSDSGLTLSMLPLPLDLERIYETLHQSMIAGQLSMVPGALSSSVPEAMWEVLRHGGISTSFPHGHGIGLEIRDYPILVPKNGLRIRDDCVNEPSDLPLEYGMVLNLEVMVFLPGRASLHLEQSFVLLNSGAKPLVTQDRRRPVFSPTIQNNSPQTIGDDIVSSS